MTWQPIETAAKDETWVLLWQEGTPYIGSSDGDGWWTDDERYNDSSRKQPPFCKPTHWMPLPAPPSTDPGIPVYRVNDGGDT